MEVGDVEVEEVWAELGSDDLTGESDADAESGPEVRVQDKHVCHGCEYFSTPPEMHCEHEGTEIREVADTEHYEVLDCPMIVGEDFE
jgi:hypothetical protein